MSLSELIDILPVPAGDLPVDVNTWDRIEKKLGLTLPPDYREFCQHYGPGKIVDHDRLDVIIHNPLDPQYLQGIEYGCDAMRHHNTTVHDILGQPAIYDVYPITPSLFPLGCDDNCNNIYWLTGGASDLWPIVIREHGCWPVGAGEYQRFDMPFVPFLTKVLKREITCRVWPAPFFCNRHNIVYEKSIADEME